VSEAKNTHETKEKIMRAFLMCAVLTVVGLAIATPTVSAQEIIYRGRYYHGPRPVVVVRPGPIVVGSAPVVVAPVPTPIVATPPAVVAPVPAPVVVQPVFRPLISIRLFR
jgi:hypothetical protein